MNNKVNIALAALFAATVTTTVTATEVGGTYITAGMMNISTDRATTFGVGYQYDENIAFEAGVISEYDVSAAATTTSASSGTLNGKSYSILTGTVVTLKAKIDTGYTLGTKYSSSINESFDIYGKAGLGCCSSLKCW